MKGQSHVHGGRAVCARRRRHSPEPETAQRYQELAAVVDKHCPVLDLFRNPVPVDRTITAG